jgi:hypothetical protein
MGKVSAKFTLLSFALLLYLDCLMHFGGFARIHKTVRKLKVRSRLEERQCDKDLALAVDIACVFYFKRVLCLQRSAALAMLLRREGIDAKMIIGAQLLPFLSHAWVEVGGSVINDKPYIGQIFQVLDCC